jgi:hypothetical protein
VLSGCLDSREESLGTPLVWPAVRTVDDFEDPNELPSWTMLRPWRCFAWPDHDGSIECQVESPGVLGDGHAYVFSFDLGQSVTAANQASIYPGAEMRADSLSVPFDVRRYDELTFEMKLESTGELPLPADLQIRTVLSCPDLAATPLDGSAEPVSVESAVSPPRDGVWRRFRLELSDFIQPSWQEIDRIEASSCLSELTGLAFQISAEGPGRRMTGTLGVDNVEFHDFESAPQTLPALTLFSPWFCEAWGAGSILDCAAKQRSPSMAIALEPSTPGSDVPGAALCTHAVDATIGSVVVSDPRDLTAFESLAISAHFEPVESPGVQAARFIARLECPGLSPDDATPPGIEHEFTLTRDRSSSRLAFARFRRPSFELIAIDEQRCLSQVTTICVRTDLRGGESLRGALSIDELVLR